jgi:hypothetical protein
MGAWLRDKEFEGAGAAGGIQPSCQQSMKHPYCISTNKCLKTYANIQSPFSADFSHRFAWRRSIYNCHSTTANSSRGAPATPPLPTPIIPKQFSNPEPKVKSSLT